MRSRLSGAVAGLSGLVILVIAASSCSDGDDLAASETLAPIQTTSTTSTTLPTTTTQPQYYEVQSGDTLTKIAAAFGLPIPAIMELNGIVDPERASRPVRSSSCPWRRRSW